VSVWNCIQIDSCQFYRRKRIFTFIIDESMVQAGYKHAWIWIAIESVHKSIIGIHISEERIMFVTKNFIHSLVSKYGKHTIYTDGGTPYPQVCTFLHLKHRLHLPLEKSMIERMM
jgi:putative transposase